MNVHKTFQRTLSALLITMAAITITLSCLTVAPTLGGWGTYAVTSSSMTPLIPPGSLVLVNESVQGSAVHTNDVVAFRQGGTDESVCVHRAKTIDQEGGLIETKGDANETADLHLVPFEDVTGVVCAHVPFAGFALLWLETHRMTLLGIAGALILARTSLSLVSHPSRKKDPKKGTECPNNA